MGKNSQVTILFVWDGLGGGGKERRFVQLVKGLNDEHYGKLYLLLTRDILAYKELERYNIHITYISRDHWSFIFQYYNFLYHLKPNIIQMWSEIPLFHYNFIRPLYWNSCAVSLSAAADCDFNLKPFKKRLLYLFSYKWLDNVVGNSKAGLTNYRVPISLQHCIYNGFDSSRITKDADKDIRKELNIKTKYVVSMVARFTRAKDWKLFVDAACIILNKREDVTFFAVGDGETRVDIESYLPESYKDQFLFLGRRNDIEAILRGTDISILCSNPEEHAEGVSNSILESCAFSVPVIATRGGGTSEILEEGQNGFLIEPHDKKTLSNRINYLLENQDVLHKMGTKAKRIYEERFSLTNATIQYINLFDQMINSRL